MTPNPCYNNGLDCPRRRLGCRSECEEWKKYEKIHADEKELERQRKFSEADDYTKHLMSVNMKKAKRKRRIGQL